MPSKSTDYGITLNGIVDLSQARKDIQAFTSKSKDEHRKVVLNAEVETKSASEKLENAINRDWIPKVENGMKRINTVIKSFNVDGIGINKVVETFKNDLGKIEERVSYFKDSTSKKLKPLETSLNVLKEGVKSIVTETETSISKMGNFDAKITKTTETIRDTNNQTKEIITKTTEWVDAQKKLNQQIEKTDKDGNQLSAVVIKISNDSKKAAKFVNELAEATSKISPKDGVNRTETRTFVDANGVKTVTEYANGIRQLTTETRQYTNNLRELVTEVRTYEGEERKLVSVKEQKTRDIQQELQQEREQINARFDLREETIRLREEEERLNNALISTTTTTSEGAIQQFGDESGRYYNALVTQIERVDEANRRVIETTYEFTNAQGQLVRQTRTTDAENNKLAEDTIEISNANNRAAESNRNLANSTREATVAQQSMGSALSRALTILTQYYLASLPIRAVRMAIQETVTTLKDFDDALIEFRKVSDLAGTSLTQYVAKLTEMGEITGSTMQAMVEAAT